MKYLTDREEIAMAMNFDKYPVLYIDRDNKKYDRPERPSDYCVGSKCKLDWEHKNPRYSGMTARCELYYSEGRYALSQGAACLTNSFGRQDVLEMVEWARVPTLRCGQTVIVVEDFSKEKKCCVRMMKVSDRKDIHCSTVARLEDIDEAAAVDKTESSQVEKKFVASEEVYSPQNYLELVTGNCYVINGDNDVKTIESILKKQGLCLWNYPMSEIDHIVENDLSVVLVDCLVENEETGEFEHTLRWFEVGEGYTEEK